MTKRCTKCKVEKAESEFFRNKNAPDGLKTACKTCCKEQHRRLHKADPGKAKRERRRLREANPEKAKKYGRDWYAANKEKGRKYASDWRKENRIAHCLQVSRSTAKKRGHVPCTATVEELKSLWTGRCEICGVPELELTKHLSMDHNHETGEFRGWLCPGCNHGLGLFKDSEEILIDALHYLMAHQHQK